MNKILTVTGIEISKQLKKLSVKIIIISILVLAFLAPIALKYISPNQDKKVEEFQDMLISQTKNNIDSITGNSDSDKVQKKSYEIELSRLLLMQKYNKEDLSWLNDESMKYHSAASLHEICKMLNDGISIDVITQNYYNSNTIEIQTLSQITPEQRNKKLLEYKKAIELSKQVIEKNNYQSYIKERINTLMQNSDTNKRQIAILEYRLKYNIAYSKSQWKSNLLDEIADAETKLSTPLLTESEFKRNPISTSQKPISYEEYKASALQSKKELKNQIQVNWYAIENNIVPLHYANDARFAFDKIYNIFILFAIIITVIIGSGIVANEFSKGTIRLLLIRPISRLQFILSKFIATLVVGLGLVFASLIVLTISSGIFFGFNTLFTPILSVNANEIIRQNYFIVLLPKIIAASCSLIFAASLTFMLSTITKNAAVAAGIPLILMFVGDPLTNMLLHSNIKWVVNSFIPYMNIPMSQLLPLDQSMLTQLGVSLNPVVGVIWLIGLSTVFIVTSFISFIKSDVKN